MARAMRGSGPRIYNLFPLLAGRMPEWRPHLERAQRMGFNWVCVNPFHSPGFSGSLYAVKDYYEFHPLLVAPEAGPPREQLANVVEQAHGRGMKIMMDLVVNHTAIDSPLVQAHPEWYQRDEEGQILHPGADEDGRRVTWGDLATMDNAGSADREGLWNYWLELASHYAGLGFDGFRCDAAYQVPSDLWEFLIRSVRKTQPQRQFFAESLGCTPEQTQELAEAGFDFIFNSSKWWDFTEPWCLEQYRRTAPIVPSISFPETHDTERLATELKGNRSAVRQRYALAAFFSTGVMIPMGFEYGFRRRLHVVETRPRHWEAANWDDTRFIREVNAIKESYAVWNEEGPMEALESGNEKVLALHQSTRDRHQRGLLLFNKDRKSGQSCSLPSPRDLLGERVMELVPGSEPRPAEFSQEMSLPAAGFRIFLGESHAARV